MTTGSADSQLKFSGIFLNATVGAAVVVVVVVVVEFFKGSFVSPSSRAGPAAANKVELMSASRFRFPIVSVSLQLRQKNALYSSPAPVTLSLICANR